MINNSIQDTLQTIRDEFDLFTDPRDKYIFLVDMAKESPGLDVSFHTEENKIHGCTSQAWIVLKEGTGGIISFHTDSDAMIVKGLLYLLERLFNGHTRQEVQSVDGQTLLENIGLGGAISSQRTNGFAGAINKIKNEILV